MGLPELWEVWEVEFLLLVSLSVQVLLLVFTECRRRVSSARLSVVLNGILWLLYLMADDIAIYVLGHMSLISKPRKQQQLMAFWASLLLVHLGGQDTITAYAIEDNNLWLRHMFTLAVQATGTGYVLHKYVVGGSRALLAAAVMMFLVGFVKYAERIYALYSSRLDRISKYVDDDEMMEDWIEEQQDSRRYPIPDNLDDPEEVLKGAHDLLDICKGQLVDYQVRPTPFQNGALSVYHPTSSTTNPDGTIRRSKMLELVGMQLSLMRDILYTKAAVIHSWYGCASRFFLVVSTILAFYLFRQSAGGGGSYGKGDMVVTYTLLGGAFFLEAASLLRAVTSTWTCAWLQAAGWKRLHATSVRLRSCWGFRTAQRCRRWSRCIRQLDLSRHDTNKILYRIAYSIGVGQVLFFDSVVMSDDVEDLLLQELHRMVVASGRDEHTLWGYRGQLALHAWGAGFCDTVGADARFDASVLTWHYATDAFTRLVRLCICLSSPSDVLYTKSPTLEREMAKVPRMLQAVHGMKSDERDKLFNLAEAVRTLSRYMVFLLDERPHLLPSTVRRSEYNRYRAEYVPFRQFNGGNTDRISHTMAPSVNLAYALVDKCENEGQSASAILRVISGVWVEMLCHAAGHSSNHAHARQLSSGTEFITVAWILTTFLLRY